MPCTVGTPRGGNEILADILATNFQKAPASDRNCFGMRYENELSAEELAEQVARQNELAARATERSGAPTPVSQTNPVDLFDSDDSDDDEEAERQQGTK